jgi:hypothetical protein
VALLTWHLHVIVILNSLGIYKTMWQDDI